MAVCGLKTKFNKKIGEVIVNLAGNHTLNLKLIFITFNSFIHVIQYI